MTSAQKNLIDYTATLQTDPDRWLGLVTLYSVAEATVSHADLETVLTTNGLGGFVPRRPADADVFRRTCTAAQRKRQPTADPDVYVNVLIRDVANDEEIVKRLVIETVDQKGRRLDYHEVYSLIFTKDGSTVDVKRLGKLISPVADEVAMGITREYKRLVGTVDGACIRTVIARVLDGSHAVSLRPGGGCYFVAREDAAVVAGLEAFAGAIEGTMVHSVPLPNDPKQRENLLAAVEDEAKVEIERAIANCTELLQAGKPISGELMATLAGKYRGLTEKAERYATLLETNLGSTKAALRILDMQMGQLAGVGQPATFQGAAA